MMAAFAVTGGQNAEYSRWSRAQKQYDMVTRDMNAQAAYEARAILERWHISTYNFTEGKELREHPITKKMRSEFLEKKLFTPATVDSIIDRIFAIQPDPIPADARPEIKNGFLRFGKFKRVFPRARIALFEKLGLNAEHIVATALRYAAMTPGGQQWSLPARVYDLFVGAYNVTLEGFASPFNSQIMRFMPEKKGLGFCSLFPDLDAAFGSLGSFFDVELTGRNTVINPPYVIDIMDAVAGRCTEACKVAAARGAPTRMFIIVPNWTDAAFYEKLSSSPFLEKMLVHQRGTHFYEDPNNNDAPIVATFARTIFILSAGGIVPGGDYHDITEAVSVPETRRRFAR
jgi:hypothetical protein